MIYSYKQDELYNNLMYFLFPVDASAAGPGDIDVEVLHNNKPLRTKRSNLGNNRHSFTYVPDRPGDHKINVTFNYAEVPGKIVLWILKIIL